MPRGIGFQPMIQTNQREGITLEPTLTPPGAYRVSRFKRGGIPPSLPAIRGRKRWPVARSGCAALAPLPEPDQACAEGHEGGGGGLGDDVDGS